MTTLLYAEIKLKADMKDEFLDLVNSPEGFPITKSKPGFISAETAISTDESGQNTFHLWEKWEKIEDFENYMQTLIEILNVNLFSNGEVRWTVLQR